MHANQAREIADNTKQELYREEFDRIMNDIKLRSSEGLYFVTYENENFSSSTLNIFRAMGYNIIHGHQHNDEYTEINWR